MTLLIVGSVALDAIQTPTDSRENILGGSAVFAAYAASFFGAVQMVGVVGEDWPQQHTTTLQSHGIDTAGLEIAKGGKTFRWTGKYFDNMNDRETLDVQLNVLEHFKPKLPDSFRRAQYVFIGNGAPSTGLETIEQIQGADLVVADTMDLWIQHTRPELETLMKKLDGLVLNDSEAKMLTGELNTITAGRKILGFGPKFVVVKKGEHGSLFISEYETYAIPAFPTEKVVDPTGAGDSFAGGMMGYIASQGKMDGETIKKALVYGTLVASFCVEGFSLERFQEIDKAEIDRRLDQFRTITSF